MLPITVPRPSGGFTAGAIASHFSAAALEIIAGGHSKPRRGALFNMPRPPPNPAKRCLRGTGPHFSAADRRVLPADVRRIAEERLRHRRGGVFPRSENGNRIADEPFFLDDWEKRRFQEGRVWLHPFYRYRFSMSFRRSETTNTGSLATHEDQIEIVTKIPKNALGPCGSDRTDALDFSGADLSGAVE